MLESIVAPSLRSRGGARCGSLVPSQRKDDNNGCGRAFEDIVLATPAPAARLAPRPLRTQPTLDHSHDHEHYRCHEHHSSDPSPQYFRAPGPVLVSSPPRGHHAQENHSVNNFPNRQTQLQQTFEEHDNSEIPPSLTRGISFGGLPCSDSTRQQPRSSEFVPTLTGDTTGEIKVEDKGGNTLGDWFKGSSAPVTFGIRTATTSTNTSSPSTNMDSYSAASHRSTTRPTAHKRSSTLQSISSFLSGGGSGGSKSASTRAKHSSMSAPDDDEFLNLDINAALFPNGAPPTSDPSANPHAFRNLLSNAEATILRIQTAYKLRTMALHDVNAEKSAQAEELEESQTRARHLKMQLDDLSAKVAEQERTMKELVDELSAERLRRHEEDEARKRTIMLVRPEPELEQEHDVQLSENDTARLATKRISRASDSGFESEDDSVASVAESIFSSRPVATDRTGAASVTSDVTRVTSSSSIHQDNKSDLTYDPSTPPARPAEPRSRSTTMTPNRASTFQKMLHGVGATSLARATADATGCANCKGQDASMAWNIVGHLRIENAELHTRVDTLEGAVESCLDVVSGLRV